jgi:hypothetical protein
LEACRLRNKVVLGWAHMQLCVASIQSRRERKRFTIFTQPSSTFLIKGTQNQKSRYFNSRQKDTNKESRFLATVSGTCSVPVESTYFACVLLSLPVKPSLVLKPRRSKHIIESHAHRRYYKEHDELTSDRRADMRGTRVSA